LKAVNISDLEPLAVGTFSPKDARFYAEAVGAAAASGVSWQPIPNTDGRARLEEPNAELDLVPNEGRDYRIEYALSNSFGFGGLCIGHPRSRAKVE